MELDGYKKKKREFMENTWLGRKISQVSDYIGNSAFGKFCKNYLGPGLKIVGGALTLAGVPIGLLLTKGG
jgi:hypothetical protein